MEKSGRRSRDFIDFQFDRCHFFVTMTGFFLLSRGMARPELLLGKLWRSSRGLFNLLGIGLKESIAFDTIADVVVSVSPLESTAYWQDQKTPSVPYGGLSVFMAVLTTLLLRGTIVSDSFA